MARKPPDPLADDIRALKVAIPIDAGGLGGPQPPRNPLSRLKSGRRPPGDEAEPPGIAQAITETRLRRFRVWALRELRALGVIARVMEAKR